MSGTTQTGSGFRITGWHALAIITGFFAIVIAVDTGFVVMAVRTFPGEVSSTPYEDGLAFNRSLAALDAQQRLGWRATASAAPGAIVIEMRDRSGRPLTGLALTGRLERPATEAGRIALTFRETDAGRYVAPARGLTGAWDLTAQAANRRGATFSAERRLTWP